MAAIDVGGVIVHRIEDGPPISVDAGLLFAEGDWRAAARRSDWIPANCFSLAEDTVDLSFNGYVIRLDAISIVVDTGIGVGKDRSAYPEYHGRRSTYLGQLEKAGVDPGTIDYVVCTHLHADHVGWNTVPGSAGWVPTFPKATYVFPEIEFEHLERRHAAGERDHWAMAAFEDSIRPIAALDGRMCLWREGEQPVPGLRLHAAGGHSAGQYTVEFTARGLSAVFSADIVHHPIQIADPRLVVSYDEDRAAARRTRHRFLRRYVDTGTLLFPPHFPDNAAGRLRSRNGEYVYEPADPKN